MENNQDKVFLDEKNKKIKELEDKLNEKEKQIE